MRKTKIEYLTHTWNPIAMRCTPISDGCKNCWHLGVVDRFNLNNNGTRLRVKELAAPLKRKKPAVIGVQFMGDLWHESVPFEFIIKIFRVMQQTPQHTYLVLTKRSERMLQFVGMDRVYLPNVWLGVTAENQETAEKRIPILLQTPAAVRFVSVEPMLSHIYLHELFGKTKFVPNWVLCGCESGANRRPCKTEWMQSIVNQCKDANVPVFVKQVSVDGKVNKDMQDWQEGLRVRDFPNSNNPALVEISND